MPHILSGDGLVTGKGHKLPLCDHLFLPDIFPPGPSYLIITWPKPGPPTGPAHACSHLRAENGAGV